PTLHTLPAGASTAPRPHTTTRTRPAIPMLGKRLARIVADSILSDALAAVAPHISITALCFYNVSTRYTFSRIFEKDMSSPKALAARREVVVDTIERWCAAK